MAPVESSWEGAILLSGGEIVLLTGPGDGLPAGWAASAGVAKECPCPCDATAEVIQAPLAYLKSQWPLHIAAVRAGATDIAVAGSRGVAGEDGEYGGRIVPLSHGTTLEQHCGEAVYLRTRFHSRRKLEDQIEVVLPLSQCTRGSNRGGACQLTYTTSAPTHALTWSG